MITREEIDSELIRFAPVEHQEALTSHDQAVKDLLFSYTAFKERIAYLPEANKRDDRTIALHLNLARMVENLDGCRIAILGGRSPLAKAALRMMYEGWTNILVIGYHSGAISNKGRLATVDPVVTQDYLAAHFMGFATFARWSLHEHRLASQTAKGTLASIRGISESEAQTQIDEQKLRADAAAARFGFTDRTLNWHPFNGAHGIKSHLWPKGQLPLFPAADFGISEQLWDDLYDLAYRFASHEVHGSPVALLSRFGVREGVNGLVHDSVFYEPETLIQATGLFVFAAISFARALGVEAAFEASFGS